VDFEDVPPSSGYRPFVANLAGNGITGGCASGRFCPGSPTLRSHMAVFLLTSKLGLTYSPPPPAGLFYDVPVTDPFAPWIEDLVNRGISGGCSISPPLFCPASAVSREQMAVFLLTASLGASYAPPPAQGIFADVPATDPFARWIEDSYNRGITAGCNIAPLLYCPDDPVIRAQMAVFLVTSFGLVFP
jgi:S-layer family protein